MEYLTNPFFLPVAAAYAYYRLRRAYNPTNQPGFDAITVAHQGLIAHGAHRYMSPRVTPSSIITAADESRKRPASPVTITIHPNKRARMSARTRGRRAIRSYRRRKFRRRFRRGKRGLAKFILRVLRRNQETHEAEFSTPTTSQGAGDGTTKVLTIVAPVQQIGESNTAEGLTGDSIFVRGLKFIGQLAANENNNVKFTIMVLMSKKFMDADTLSTFLSTTTLTANPTQVAPAANLHIFDEDAGAERFVNTIGSTRKIMPDIHVLAKKEWTFRADYTGNTADVIQDFKRINWYIPINKRFVFRNPETETRTLEMMGQRNLYVTYQVHAPAPTLDISSTVTVQTNFLGHIYFKEV